MGKLQSSSLDRRFFHRLGASMLDRTICASAGSPGYEYTMGRGRLGADPLAVPGCKFIVNWGSNTANTNSHLWSLMIEARKAGATIVTVDPYRSPTARRSDWHIQPRPGTDAALALGLMHVIWRDGLQDDDYLQQGHGRRRAAAPSASSTSIRPRRSRRSPASTSATIDDASPIGWPASSRR